MTGQTMNQIWAIFETFEPRHKNVLLSIKMPYRLLDIGQLLFLLPNPELKQKVRILEKLNKRFINAKIFTIFNRTYIYIYIYKSRLDL